MKLFTLLHPTKKVRAPKQCSGCGKRHSLKRVVNLDDQAELVHMRQKNQNRVLINGRWTKIAKVATVSYHCTSCEHTQVVWRDIQRKPERGVLAPFVTYRT